jgi:RND family efflux transporter MFP subunit
MRLPRFGCHWPAALLVVLFNSLGCKSTPPPRAAPEAPAAPVAAAAPSPSAAPAGPAATAAPKAPPAHTIARGTLKRTLAVDAVLEAVEMRPVRLEPKVWLDLTVVEAVPHGTRVKAGDLLVKLDLEKLREQISDLEQDTPAAAIALEAANAELANLAETTPQRLETTRRNRRVVDEDQQYFEQHGRERRERSALFNVKSAEQRLANSTEELKQLEKMYKADDLTEETEEIILKRQKFEVEAAQFSLDNTKANTDRELKTLIPRETENLKAQKRDQELAVALAEETLPKAVTRKKLEVEKLARDQKKSQKRLADLKADLDRLEVRAPLDGVVMHGACEGGKWTTGAIVGKKLVPGGKLAPFEVFLTVANPDRLQLKAVVPEAELGKAKTGMTGEAAPVAQPDRKLPVKLERLDRVPLATGGFEATFSLSPSGPADLLPGMNCKITLTDSSKPNVLLAPAEAVFTEGDRKHVFVLLSDGKSEKRTVRTGESEGKSVEILEGLSEGDKILLTKPQ